MQRLIEHLSVGSYGFVFCVRLCHREKLLRGFTKARISRTIRRCNVPVVSNRLQTSRLPVKNSTLPPRQRSVPNSRGRSACQPNSWHTASVELMTERIQASRFECFRHSVSDTARSQCLGQPSSPRLRVHPEQASQSGCRHGIPISSTWSGTRRHPLAGLHAQAMEFGHRSLTLRTLTSPESQVGVKR